MVDLWILSLQIYQELVPLNLSSFFGLSSFFFYKISLSFNIKWFSFVVYPTNFTYHSFIHAVENEAVLNAVLEIVDFHFLDTTIFVSLFVWMSSWWKDLNCHVCVLFHLSLFTNSLFVLFRILYIVIWSFSVTHLWFISWVCWRCWLLMLILYSIVFLVSWK